MQVDFLHQIVVCFEHENPTYSYDVLVFRAHMSGLCRSYHPIYHYQPLVISEKGNASRCPKHALFTEASICIPSVYRSYTS